MGRSAESLTRDWLDALKHERRVSPHTLRAYGDDLARFTGFLKEHLGGAVDGAAGVGELGGGSELDLGCGSGGCVEGFWCCGGLLGLVGGFFGGEFIRGF